MHHFRLLTDKQHLERQPADATPVHIIAHRCPPTNITDSDNTIHRQPASADAASVHRSRNFLGKGGGHQGGLDLSAVKH